MKNGRSILSLEGADLGNAQLKTSSLRKINLAGADLTNADLQEADLTDGDLGDANLTKAHLGNTLLVNAKLAEANLVDADLTGADLTGSDLTRAIASESQFAAVTLCSTKAGFDGAINNRNCDRVGVTYYDKGERRDSKYRAKLAALTEIIQRNPTSAIAYNDRGILAFNHDEFDKAIEDFSAVVKLDQSRVSAYLFRGGAYVRRATANNNKQDYDLAIQDLNKVIQHDS